MLGDKGKAIQRILGNTRQKRSKHPWAHRKQAAHWRLCKFNQCKTPHKETKYKGHCSVNCQKRRNVNKRRGYQFDLGHPVRSGWERKYADWLIQMGFKFNPNYKLWETQLKRTAKRGNYYFYEPKKFKLRGGLNYLPDFYISKTDTWVEVKGYMTKKDEEKIRKFIEAGHRLLVVDKKFFNSKYFKS